MATFGVILSPGHAHAMRTAMPGVGLVLLERTLLDPPRAQALRRWSAQVRRTFPDAELVPYVWHLVTHAAEDGLLQRAARTLPGPPTAFGHLRDTREIQQAWAVSRQAAEILGTRRMALRTPSGVSPGSIGRTRLRAAVDAQRAEGFELVWEPEGLWDPPSALAVGDELGIRVILPAFEGGRPLLADEHGPVLVDARAWLRIEGRGRRPRLTPDQIDAIVDHVDAIDDAVLLFAGSHALANCRDVLARCG